MLPFLRDGFGNASSRHELGTLARQAVGWALVQAGSVDEGIAQSRRGVELAGRTGRDYDQIQAAATHAFHLFVAGRPEQGIEFATAAAERAVALGLRWTESFCVNQRVEALMWTGRFDEAEISKEKGVILEEMNVYLDTPQRYVGNVYDRLLYADQPLGWDILGTCNTQRDQTAVFHPYDPRKRCVARKQVGLLRAGRALKRIGGRLRMGRASCGCAGGVRE
jgi:hypothetical protein